MPSEHIEKQRISPLHSLFYRCTFMVAICTLLVATVIEVRTYFHAQSKIDDTLGNRAKEVSRLLGMQLGNAILSDNVDVVSNIVNDVVEAGEPELLGALILDRELEPFYTSRAAAFDVDLSTDLGVKAFSNDAPMVNADSPGFNFTAIPITAGANSRTIGVIVTAWTSEIHAAELASEQGKTILWALGVLLAALLFAAYFLRVQMSRPLEQLRQSMANIAAEDFDAEVPHATRKDEIGGMARSLDRFRIELAQGKENSREMAFKSAAFVGSSAPLMLANEDFVVTFVNPACEALMEKLSEDLPDVWSGMTPQDLSGGNLNNIVDIRQTIATFAGFRGTANMAELMAEKTLHFGKRRVRIRMNPAVDDEGNMLGCVVEWNDLTEAQLNAAMIGAINTRLLSIEFGADGRVYGANDNFLAVINGTFADTKACSLSRMFANNLDNDPGGKQFETQVLSGQIQQGRYSVYSAHAQKSFMCEGSFALIPGENGETERVMFLGSDVTEIDQSMRKAEEERAQADYEQGHVVRLLGDGLTKLSDGDLESAIDEEVPVAYEKLRSDFNSTVGALKTAISSVVHNADSIRNETNEITSAADDLSRRTEKQAATLEETAAALDELTASVRSAAQGADDASKMSAEAQTNAQQGGEIARQAMNAMDGIKTSSQEISKITSVIDDIAFQTNLLALNAGVEAARAGEAGRGFAVVATEVRALAQRSSDAAREINTLISSSGDQVKQGVDLVDRTGEALSAIVTSVAEISNRVSAIATSAREQSSGLAEINTAVNELDHVTQQNAAMFEETTAASHALTAEADALANAVAHFRGAGSASAPRPQSATSAAAPGPAAQRVRATMHGNAALKVSPDAETDGWEEF